MIKVDVLSPKESTPKHKALMIKKMRKILVTCIWCSTKNSHNPNIKCDSDCFLCPASDTVWLWVFCFQIFHSLPPLDIECSLFCSCLSAYLFIILYLCLFQLILQTYLCNYVIINVLFCSIFFHVSCSVFVFHVCSLI